MDLVEISRIEALLHRNEGKAVQRLLTSNEAALMSAFDNDRRKAEWVAGRFAAKEAFAKAIGTGIGGEISMQDIEIMPDRFGKPGVILSHAAERKVGFPFQCHISITHTASTAGAVIIIEKGSDGE